MSESSMQRVFTAGKARTDDDHPSRPSSIVISTIFLRPPGLSKGKLYFFRALL
jgi:hypothetical protein